METQGQIRTCRHLIQRYNELIHKGAYNLVQRQPCYLLLLNTRSLRDSNTSPPPYGFDSNSREKPTDHKRTKKKHHQIHLDLINHRFASVASTACSARATFSLTFQFLPAALLRSQDIAPRMISLL